MTKIELNNSIRNDLLRLSYFAVTQNTDLNSPQFDAFLNHAQQLFSQYSGQRSKELSNELTRLTDARGEIADPLSRLRWSEKILTLSCRL